MRSNCLVEQIKDLLNQVKYEGKFLTEEEKYKLLERWHNSVKHNKERLVKCYDPDLNGFVVGLQYYAICDDRSCGFCTGHHGEALKINDPRIKENTPPIHLGCRCGWSPVTKLEVKKRNFQFKWSNIKKPDFGLITL